MARTDAGLIPPGLRIPDSARVWTNAWLHSDSMGWLVVIAGLLGVGYVVSLRLHPLRRCPACKGTGRHKGGFYAYAYRNCNRCGGGSRQLRLGARMGLGGARQQLPGKGRGGA